jgi:acetate kinase
MRFCVHDNYFVRLAMHIDTDEGNAGNIHNGALHYIEEIQSQH